MSNVVGPGDVGVKLTLQDDLDRGVSRVNQALTQLAATVERVGQQIDKAMAQAAKNAQEASRGTRRLTEEEKKAAAAAKEASEARKRQAAEEKKAKEAARNAAKQAKQAEQEAARAAREHEKAAAAAARQQKQAMSDMREGLQQISMAAAAVAVGLGVVAKVSSDAYKQQQSAFLGLDSVASKTVGNLAEVQAAAESLISDGLMTVVEASKAVQAGLASGFSLQETIDLINTFRDSAAFNRQAGLEFGEAVVRAMEGVRMGNSILADAAGITKNLSMILKEAGYAEQDLSRVSSDAAVRRALYNGILKEGALFAGNAAKAADTLAGAESRAATEAFNAKAAVGESLSPALQELAEVTTSVLGKITAFAEANPELARTAFLVVGGITAVTAAVGGLTVALLAMNTALGPIGWAVLGISALVGALAGAAAAGSANARAAEAQQRAILDLSRDYERLNSVLQSNTASDEAKRRAQEDLKRVIQELGNLMPELVTKWDAEGKAIELNTEKLKANTEEVLRNKAAREAKDVDRARTEAQQAWGALEMIEREMNAAIATQRRIHEDNLARGVITQDQFNALVASDNDVISGSYARQLKEARDKAAKAQGEFVKALTVQGGGSGNIESWDFDPNALGKPKPGEHPPGGSKMSPALASALEDLADLQALEKTPENLERTLARVREILSTHGAELTKLGKSRDLERMANIVLPQQILDAADQATSQEFRAALEQLNAATQLEDLSPEAIRERLEAIRDQFSTYLEAHPDQALQMELRLKGASDAEIRAPLERWQEMFRQNDRLGLYSGMGGDSLKLRSLREGQALALGAGDTNTWADLTGQIQQLEAAMQQADFEGRFERIASARGQAFTAAAEEMANLERQLIDAESGSDEGKAAGIRQRMLDLVRPALEAQKAALEALLQDEQLTAAQREQVEADLARVKSDLYDQDIAAHRIATEAKTAAERAAAAERQSLEAQQMVWVRAIAQADLDDIQARQRADESRQQARIKGLQEELSQLERQWAAEDRRNQLDDLRAQLTEVMADTSFQKVDENGNLVWTYDEARARDLQKQIAQAETEERRATERERLQDQITAAQTRLERMQAAHQTELDERQSFWQRVMDGDLSAFEDLTEAAKLGLGPWVDVFKTKLDELQTEWEAKASAIEEAARRINGAVNSTLSGMSVAPTLPASMSASTGAATAGTTIAVGSMPIHLPNVTNAQEFAEQLPAALTSTGIDIGALTRYGRAGLRAL